MDSSLYRPRIRPLRTRRARWSLALLACVQSLPGCTDTWVQQREPLPAEQAAELLAESTVHDPDPVARQKLEAKEPAEALSIDGWAHQVGAPPIAGDKSERHWRHVELETSNGQILISTDELLQATTSGERIVAANAQMLLARSTGSPTTDEELAAIVADAALSAPMRAAAVETLAEHAGDPVQTTLLSLLEDQDRSAAGANAAYAADVHIELLQRVAAKQPPTVSPAFVRALDAQDPRVRKAAVEIWAEADAEDAPRQIVDLANDNDASVRAAALSTLAAMRHPLALESARNGLHDPQLDVHLAAIAALGKTSDPDATELLRREAAADGNVIRAAAVDALAEHGDASVAPSAASDSDSTVRAAAGRALRSVSPQIGLGTARTLLSDRSMAVRRAAIQSLAAWPLADAAPLLLEAMSDRALDTRKAAHVALAERFPAADYRPHADATERQLQIAALRERLRVHDGALGLPRNETPESPAVASAASSIEIPAERVETLLRVLAEEKHPERQAAIDELQRAPRQLEMQLVRWSDEQGQMIPASVYEEVLAPSNAILKQLADWKSLTSSERRQCVGAIALSTDQSPMTPLAARRLIELVQFTEDPWLWQAALDACRASGDRNVRRFAAAALGHAAPDVRRRACDYFADHPASDAVQWLNPLLTDSVSYVAGAAASAIGGCGQPADLRPLVALCSHADADCRLAAAEALARWRDERGYAALERLALDRDPAVRIRAAQAMGEIAAPEFAATLIPLLDDDLGVRRAALASLPYVTGEQLVPADEFPAPAMSEQVTRWKRWASQRR